MFHQSGGKAIWPMLGQSRGGWILAFETSLEQFEAFPPLGDATVVYFFFFIVVKKYKVD